MLMHWAEFLMQLVGQYTAFQQHYTGFNIGTCIFLILELASFSDIEDEEREEAVRRCCQAVCRNDDTTGVNWLVSEIASM